MYQAIESFKRIFPGEKIGQIGDGWIDLQNITVATMQTLAILGGIKATKINMMRIMTTRKRN